MAEKPEAIIGERVKKCRQAIGMTQKGLSEALRVRGWEIDPTGVTRLERGKRALQVRQLYLLADALRAPLTSLLPDSPTEAAIVLEHLRDNFAELRQTAISNLYALDRLRLQLDELATEGAIGVHSIEEAITLIAADAGSDAIGLLDASDRSAAERARLYQGLIDQVFGEIAVDDEAEAEQEADPTAVAEALIARVRGRYASAVAALRELRVARLELSGHIQQHSFDAAVGRRAFDLYRRSRPEDAVSESGKGLTDEDRTADHERRVDELRVQRSGVDQEAT
jgi:transcriptional regulator with XRE-family HTH domain